MTQRITLDTEFCQAHGRCYAKFPELFDADDEGKAVIVGDGTLPESVRERDITGVCPEAAIVLV